MDHQRHRDREHHRIDRGDLAFQVTMNFGTHALDEPTIVLLHGIGGRPRPRTDVSVPRMAGEPADVLASLGLDHVVVGHSMGAAASPLGPLSLA